MAVNERQWRKWRSFGAIGSVQTARNREVTGIRKTSGIRAVAYKVDGQIVLDDPDALAMINAVGKHNCLKTLDMNTDRVKHFKGRMTERGLTSGEAVIVVLNVDDVYGRVIADALMPGYNWQEIRDRGEVPFARGLAMREGIQGFLGVFDKEAAEKLRSMVDHGVAEVFAA